MIPSEHFIYYLIYRHIRHLKGAYIARRWVDAKNMWRRVHQRPWRCAGCGRAIRRRKDLTLDHIIPAWLLVDLEMMELLFDHRNLQPMCQECNCDKDGTLTFLPVAVRARLVTMYLEQHRTVQIQYVSERRQSPPLSLVLPDGPVRSDPVPPIAADLVAQEQ